MPPEPELPRRAFTPTEISAMTGLSAHQVRRLIRQGDLRAVDASGTGQRPHWLVPVEALEEFLARAQRVVNGS